MTAFCLRDSSREFGFRGKARMLEEFHDVLNSFAEDKSTTPFVRRERRIYAAGSVRRKGGAGSQRIARGSPPPDPQHPA